jgi:hypothetical protein
MKMPRNGKFFQDKKKETNGSGAQSDSPGVIKNVHLIAESVLHLHEIFAWMAK